jgi:hypothetical protein
MNGSELLVLGYGPGLARQGAQAAMTSAEPLILRRAARTRPRDQAVKAAESIKGQSMKGTESPALDYDLTRTRHAGEEMDPTEPPAANGSPAPRQARQVAMKSTEPLALNGSVTPVRQGGLAATEPSRGPAPAGKGGER